MGKKALAKMTLEQFEALPPYKQKQVAFRLVAGMRAPSSPFAGYNRSSRRTPEFKAALASHRAKQVEDAAKAASALADPEKVRDTEQETGENVAAPE